MGNLLGAPFAGAGGGVVVAGIGIGLAAFVVAITCDAMRAEAASLVGKGMLPADAFKCPDLEVRLTIDPALQTEATRTLERHLEVVERKSARKLGDPRLNGCVVVVRNCDSAILACVGGRSFELLQVNLATARPGRPLASAIKPFDYTCALDADPRLTILSRLPNDPLKPGVLPGYGGNFAPRESLASGTWPLWVGLKDSSNRLALAVCARAGDYHWTRQMRELKLSSGHHAKDTSLFLGSGDARPVDVAAAYACLARGGSYTESGLIEHVRTNGSIVYKRSPVFTTAISRRSSREVTKALREVLRTGTAAAYGGSVLANRFPLAGKTGTAENCTDAWFCGYGSDITVVVWIGYPGSLKAILPSASGGSIAFPVWKEVIESLARRGYSFKSLPELTLAERGAVLAKGH